MRIPLYLIYIMRPKCVGHSRTFHIERMSLSKLREVVKDREAERAAAIGSQSWT